MKITIDRNELLKPIQRVIGAVERRQTKPVLANILIEADADGITFVATDLEILLRTHLAHPVDEPGAAAVPARKLLDICKALPDDASIRLQAGPSKATLQAGRSRFSLACLPPEEFPRGEAPGEAQALTVAADALRGLIARTAFSMANQDVRYYLNGLLLEVTPGELRAVATDGHRLAFDALPLEQGGGEGVRQAIVPRKGVFELERLLQDVDGPVTLELGTSHIRATAGDMEFVSKLIDGRFPDYERVMPDASGTTIHLPRADFREALQRTAILSNEKYRGIRLMLDEARVTLQAHNAEQEEAEEQLPVDYVGPSLEVGFNVQYLLDVTNVVPGEAVAMMLKDPNHSVLVTDPALPRARYVIMPMRL